MLVKFWGMYFLMTFLGCVDLDDTFVVWRSCRHFFVLILLMFLGYVDLADIFDVKIMMTFLDCIYLDEMFGLF